MSEWVNEWMNELPLGSLGILIYMIISFSDKRVKKKVYTDNL